MTLVMRYIKFSVQIALLRGIRIGSLSSAKGLHYIDESSVVLHSPFGTARLLLFLFLTINLKVTNEETSKYELLPLVHGYTCLAHNNTINNALYIFYVYNDLYTCT